MISRSREGTKIVKSSRELRRVEGPPSHDPWHVIAALRSRDLLLPRQADYQTFPLPVFVERAGRLELPSLLIRNQAFILASNAPIDRRSRLRSCDLSLRKRVLSPAELTRRFDALSALSGARSRNRTSSAAYEAAAFPFG
jgi:hypothetical protein